MNIHRVLAKMFEKNQSKLTLDKRTMRRMKLLGNEVRSSWNPGTFNNYTVLIPSNQKTK